MSLNPNNLIVTIKAAFTTISEFLRLFKLRRCQKVIEKFLTQFSRFVSMIDSILEKKGTYLDLLNRILQTVNAVLASNLCN
jgi:hypothetical protein